MASHSGRASVRNGWRFLHLQHWHYGRWHGALVLLVPIDCPSRSTQRSWHPWQRCRRNEFIDLPKSITSWLVRIFEKKVDIRNEFLKTKCHCTRGLTTLIGVPGNYASSTTSPLWISCSMSEESHVIAYNSRIIVNWTLIVNFSLMRSNLGNPWRQCFLIFS